MCQTIQPSVHHEGLGSRSGKFCVKLAHYRQNTESTEVEKATRYDRHVTEKEEKDARKQSCKNGGAGFYQTLCDRRKAATLGENGRPTTPGVRTHDTGKTSNRKNDVVGMCNY